MKRNEYCPIILTFDQTYRTFRALKEILLVYSIALISLEVLPYVRISVFLQLFLRYEKERTTDKDGKTAQKQIAEINHNLPPSAFKKLNCLGLHFDFSSINSLFRFTGLIFICIFLTSTFNSKYEYANTLIGSDNRYRQGVIFESEDKPIGEFKFGQKFIISR